MHEGDHLKLIELTSDEDGKPNGMGKDISPDGDKYEGEFDGITKRKASIMITNKKQYDTFEGEQ